MTVAIVIPARYASSRFPGKPLAPLRGVTGQDRPLIARSWDAARSVPSVARIIVATDDARIASVASGFGADVMMTSEQCGNGTERCAAVLDRLDPEIDTIVNLQGDALLTPPWFLEALIAALRVNPDMMVATPAIRATPAVHRRLLEDQRAGRVGGTTVAMNGAGQALYFSKAVIPHISPDRIGDETLPVRLHVGVYAYRRAALERYARLSMCELELLEGLEQLRFLDAAIPIQVVEVDAEGCDIWELNNPTDIAPIEAALAARGIV